MVLEKNHQGFYFRVEVPSNDLVVIGKIKILMDLFLKGEGGRFSPSWFTQQKNMVFSEAGIESKKKKQAQLFL